MLLLAFAWVLLAFTPVMAADYQCRLLGDDEKIDDTQLHEDNPEDVNDTYFGYNYLAKYRLPNLKLVIFRPSDEDDEDKWTRLQDFTVSWDFTFDSDNLKLKELTSDASGDIFVVSGFMPDSADAYTERFVATATVVDIANDTYKPLAIGVKASFDDELEVNVTRDTDHIPATPADFARYLVYDSDDIDIHEVGPDYSVTVTMSKDYDEILQSYNRYIRSDEEYTVNIPEWLSWEITGEQTDFLSEELESEFADKKAITAIVIKFNDNYDGKLLGDLQDGTIARINVPILSADDFGASEIILSWDVTYRKPAPITITSGKTLSFTLRPGSTDVGTAEYTGSNPVRIASSDVSSDVRFIVGHTDIDEASGKGTITVTVEASDNANVGEYEKTFTFTDAYGNSDTITAKATVEPKPVQPTPTPQNPESNDPTPNTPNTPDIPVPTVRTITITGEPKTFSLKAGASSSTTLTATGDVSGAVTWSAGSVSPAADILVSATSGNASSTVSIVIGKNVAANTYSVVVSARDSAGTSASTTLRITITDETLKPDQQEQEQTDTNLTSRIRITNEAGSTVSQPFSSLKAGSSAVYTISLEGTGVTAKVWRLLVNGVAVDSAIFAAEDSWARIVTSNENSATIEANPPENLSVDSKVSVSITGNDSKEYTADLGTVKKAEANQPYSPVGSSSGGCNAGVAAMMLAVVGLFVGGKVKRK